MNENKVLFYVMTTRLNSSRVNNILNTWAKDLDIIFYSDHENYEKNIIKVSDRTDWGSNEEKQINALNLLKHLVTDEDEEVLEYYKWIFLIDDDTFVNVKKLQQHISSFDENCVYGSIFNSEKDYDNPAYTRKIVPLDMKFPSGGAGYLVSSYVIKKINNFPNFYLGAGDLSAGRSFYENDVDQIDNGLFYSQNPEFYGHDENKINESISYHYIKTIEDIEKMMTVTEGA